MDSLSFLKKPILSDTAYLLLRDLVRDRCGIYYGDHKRFLFEQRIHSRIVQLGLQDGEAYYRYLLFHPRREAEFLELFSVLTNNETYFFREVASLKALIGLLLEEWAPRFPLRILSAGCSSGEELATLAILLYEAGVDLNRTELWGLDLDPRMIELAQSGLYRSRSFRDTPPEALIRYFQPEGEERKLKGLIHRHLHFRWGNLVDPRTLVFPHPFDAVLCRNVLIYFDEDTTRKVIQHLHSLVRRKGILVIGLAESIAHIPFYFEPFRRDGVILYRREEEE
jgi:chemotaxis protein methyltransferase CheR